MPDDSKQILGYTFNDAALLRQALTHPSYINEARDHLEQDYQRLEFLGDAVLGLALADILSDRNPDLKEGSLSLLRASLADQPCLAKIAAGNGIGQAVLLGRGEEQSGGREKPSILSDIFEALLGAIYRDSDFVTVRSVVEKLYGNLLEHVDGRVFLGDPKSELQEWLASEDHSAPVYEVFSEEGPPHDRIFRVSVSVDGIFVAEGEGRSKKSAQQAAARTALEILKFRA